MEFKIGVVSTILILLTGCTSKAERAFMMGCVGHPSMQAQCECVYEQLEEHYPAEVFEKMGQGYAPPDFLPQMEKAANTCKA